MTGNNYVDPVYKIFVLTGEDTRREVLQHGLLTRIEALGAKTGSIRGKIQHRSLLLVLGDMEVVIGDKAQGAS